MSEVQPSEMPSAAEEPASLELRRHFSPPLSAERRPGDLEKQSRRWADVHIEGERVGAIVRTGQRGTDGRRGITAVAHGPCGACQLFASARDAIAWLALRPAPDPSPADLRRMLGLLAGSVLSSSCSTRETRAIATEAAALLRGH